MSYLITADYIFIIVTLLAVVYSFIVVSPIYKSKESIEKLRKRTLLTLLGLVVVIPIIEESLFRHTLTTYASDWYFHKVFNVALFGSLHIFNHIDCIKSMKLLSLLVKLFFPTYLGYYIVYHSSFPASILVHGIFNLIVFLPVHTFYILKYRQKISLRDSSDPLYAFCGDNSRIVLVNTFNSKIRKCKSFELLPNKAGFNKCISVNISNMPIDILESIKKYNGIDKKRNPHAGAEPRRRRSNAKRCE